MKKKKKKYNMNKEEIKLIEDIIIVQADKDGIFVIMDTIDQITKLEKKLNDGNIHEQVKNDPTPKIKEEISKKVTKMIKSRQNHIKYEILLNIIPKLHKVNAPIRIITCSKKHNHITNISICIEIY